MLINGRFISDEKFLKSIDNVVDEIKFKELLDDSVITQEEYEKKKKRIVKFIKLKLLWICVIKKLKSLTLCEIF